MNGALTIGTFDGANIKIREEVGAGNFFLFGLTAPEVKALRTAGYDPRACYEANEELHEVINLVRDGFFSRGNSDQFKPLVDKLLEHDPYLVLADYAAYAACQQEVDRAYGDAEDWTRRSILNTARSGKFSSDRTIREYCAGIWNVEPVPVKLVLPEEVEAGLMMQ